MNLTETIQSFCRQVRPVGTHDVPWSQSLGRVLAEPILLDRPSPACDVSAMDGYALRTADARVRTLPVSAEVQPGAAAAPLASQTVVRIFTGGMLPPGADAVIPRELVRETATHITIPTDLALVPNQHIRRCGENGDTGHPVAQSGQLISAPILAAIASCGKSSVRVFQPVRVAILVTGGEVRSVTETPAPWQLRDSNGPALHAILSNAPWLAPDQPRHAPDDPAQITAAIGSLLESADAIMITGGVSAGDHDHVPAVLKDLGVTTVFHKLPIRPGKPILAAVDAHGRPIFGLPGNPVSAMVTARRFALPALRTRAGRAIADPPQPTVTLAEFAAAPAQLTWFPLVRLSASGQATLVPSRGSGDWPSTTQSQGFVQIPPGQAASGSFPFYSWTIGS